MGWAVVMDHVTLDGMMQGPGRPDEVALDGYATYQTSGPKSASAAPTPEAGPGPAT
jgi:hypothetical protein